MPPLFHLALADEWSAAVDAGVYERSTLGTSLAEEGFIHCSFAHQVQAIADLVYRGREDVVLLRIDPDRVGAEIREENLDGGSELFPHIYGPLPVAAVVHHDSVPIAADGRLLVTDLLPCGDAEEGWMAVGAAKQRGFRLLFKQVPDPPAAEGRLHVDLTPETTRVDEVGRLVAAGATVVAEYERWTVLRDPEGNAFCVLDRAAR